MSNSEGIARTAEEEVTQARRQLYCAVCGVAPDNEDRAKVVVDMVEAVDRLIRAYVDIGKSSL